MWLMAMSSYVLRYHQFYYGRIQELKEQVRKLSVTLSKEEFLQHTVVKFAYRIRKADQEIIPEDPDRPEYKLRGELRKYRRYKQGLQRYRIIFCFANKPKIILYLYLNSEKSLRKAGGHRDPYEKFRKFVKRGNVSNDPGDPTIQKWIQDQRP